jgi:hypothetical protein
MKALVEAALVGLGRAGTPPADPDEAGDRLLARAGDLGLGLGVERAFLLRLGVHAVRARAGIVAAAASAAERPEAAPAETRPPCSAALAAIVAELCAERNTAILREALERMDARGLRLPPHALPALAALREPALLPAATGVAGERGRWLARANPAWRWLVDGVAPASLEERRRVWDEGTPDARTSALRATRAGEPAEARAWIEAAWKAEKASLREEMVEALVTGLSADDGALLEQALADRAAGVRAAAARLLARLEASPLAARARERAGAILAYTAPGGGVLGALKSRLGGKSHGTLTVSPPTAFVKAWADDGLVEKPPAGTGERAFWLRQILGLVPPAHWEQRFGASPDALVQAAAATEWAEPVLDGWTDAAVRFEARGWADRLWSARAARDKPEALGELAAVVFPLMEAATVHETLAALAGDGSPQAWNAILAAAPRPWSGALAGAVVKGLVRALGNAQLAWQEAAAWRATLEMAAVALPIAAVDHQLQVLALQPPPDEAQAAMLRTPFDTFRSVLAIRKRIAEETRS